MTVSKMGKALGRRIAEIVDELQDRTNREEVLSLAVVAEMLGERRPIIAIRGRFERDKFAALTALSRAKHLVQVQMDDSAFVDMR